MQNLIKSILLCMVMQLTVAIAVGQSTGSSTWTTEAQERLTLDRERFAFEKANESRKARDEIIKSVITGLSILIPLLLGIYTVRSQIKGAFELKRYEADNDFVLKAADVVMNAKNPFGARKKAEVMKDLFGNRLPMDFASSFDPKKHAHIGPSYESKLELLKLILANPSKEGEIVRLWRRAFPGDTLEQLFPGDFSLPPPKTP